MAGGPPALSLLHQPYYSPIYWPMAGGSPAILAILLIANQLYLLFFAPPDQGVVVYILREYMQTGPIAGGSPTILLTTG